MRAPGWLTARFAGALLTGTVIAGTVVAGTVVAGTVVAGPALAEAGWRAAGATQTRVDSFKVPAKHEIHRDLDVSGTVQKLSGGKWHGAAGATVAFYYRRLPHGTWTHAGSIKTRSNGSFDWKSAIHRLGKFRWQARVQKTTAGSTEYKPSRSAVKDTFLVDRTYVTHFVAAHLEGDTSLAAIMQDYPQSGGVSYATVTGIARFYYQPSGSTGWSYLGKSRATKGNLGSVAVEVAGTLDGRFRIVFRAQGDFLGSRATQSLS
jgi:hypothetical protein